MLSIWSGLRLPAAVLLVCLFPQFAQAQEGLPPSSLRLPTIAASVAAASDWATTYHALKYYRLREANPVLQPLSAQPGKLVAVGAVMDTAMFTAWNMTVGRKHPRLAAAGLWASTAFRTYLAIHNLRNERKVARR